jgi:hypothetical protein
MSKKDRPDVRDPFLDVLNPGEGQSGLQEKGSAEFRDQTVFPGEQFRSSLFKLRSTYMLYLNVRYILSLLNAKMICILSTANIIFPS